MGSARMHKLGSLFRRLLDRLAPPNRTELGPTLASEVTSPEVGETDEGPLYVAGSPNPGRMGFIPLRSSAGNEPDVSEVEAAARILNIPAQYVDAQGYEHEIIAAALDSAHGELAYVSSRAKEKGSFVDVEILIHLRDAAGGERAWPIQTYNPYFGCDVRYFRWMDRSALLIYREKHRTYACRISSEYGVAFLNIEDDWIIKGNTLAFREWKATSVDRVSLPDLQSLGSLPLDEAQAEGLLPSEDGC